MWFLGLLIGTFVGGLTGGFFGAFGGALLGAIAGAMFKSAITNPNQSTQALDSRIQTLEARIEHLTQTVIGLQERLKNFEQMGQQTSSGADAATAAPSEPISEKIPTEAIAAPASISVDADVELPPPRVGEGMISSVSYDVPISPPSQPSLAPAAGADNSETTPHPGPTLQPQNTSFLSGLLGGNILAKVGVVLLFFGMASGLKLAAQYGLFPIEVRLLLTGIGAAAMIAFGWNRAARSAHRMFGLALQGGGFGMLYLIVYFMLARYQMIGYTTAFMLFMLLGVGCVVLAAIEDGMSLAVLGISGAFMAPVLASSGSGNHIALFSYYAILNGFILCVNWFKGWRALNVCGFIFTFVVGMVWGTKAYQPEHFASTEAFLILFFLMYSLAPVISSLFHAPGMKGWTDGVLVFGAPIAAAFSQAFLIQPYEYGLAWSAFIAGIYYLILWQLLSRRKDPEMGLMEKSHLGIGIALLTLAIPLAFGARLTSAFWALEGTVLVWAGMNQRRGIVRLLGAALQIAGGLYFLSAWLNGGVPQETPVLNSFYLGGLILAISGATSAWFMQRAATDRLEAAENRSLSSLLLTWGLLWWFGAGCAEIHEFAARQNEVALLLSFIAISVLLLEYLGTTFSWPELRTSALLLTLAIALSAFYQYGRTRHVLEGAMAICFPLALFIHHWILYRQEKENFGLFPVVRHLLVFWLVIIVVAREVTWISRRLDPTDTLWPLLAWGAVPALFMLLTLWARKKGLWPVRAQASVYLRKGLAPIWLITVVWSIYANLTHPGGGFGASYFPLMNPFDLTQILVLLALLRRAHALQVDESSTPPFSRTVAILGFVWLSAMAARLGHHWAGIPFNYDALFGSVYVQAALSLIWTSAAILLMISATRNADRGRWFMGFTLLAIVGAKLLFVDLANAGTLAWTTSLIGIALLVLAASYFSPAPPKEST